jgi:hypothetical protein
MPYYMYLAPPCGYCGKEQGLQEPMGGRQRRYCSDRCRKAASRKRDSEKRRNAILQYNAELREYWREHHIDGQVLTLLQDILVEHGKQAARAATDAVLTERKLVREEQGQRARLKAFGR